MVCPSFWPAMVREKVRAGPGDRSSPATESASPRRLAVEKWPSSAIESVGRGKPMRIASLALVPALTVLGATLYACGSNGGSDNSGPDGSSSGGGDGGSGGDVNLFGNDGNSPDAYVPPPFEDGGFTAGDCDGGGCTFPPPGAPPCSGAPAINLVYPNDGTLVPP